MSKNKMLPKWLFACLTVLFLLAGITGCGKGEADKLPEQTENLVVYADPYLAKFLKVAVYRFSLAYPDVKVDVRDFGNVDDPQNEKNYVDVLTSELAAGGGPDLILFTPYIFGDIQKTAESGAFQDLSGYITGDADFNPDDYNSGVMEAGVINGQRLFIPISYSVDVLLTAQDTLAGANQHLPTTTQELYQQMADYGQTYQDDTNRFFTQFYDIFPYLLQTSGLSLMDYETNKVTIDNNDFRGLIDAYKDLYEMDWVRSEEKIYVEDPNVGYPGEDVKLVESGKILYIHEISEYSFVDDYAGLLSDNTPVYTAFPSVNGKPIATVTLSAAVNSHGENKTNAYYLLKIMLSEILQNYGYTNFCYYYDIPVRNGVIKDCIIDQNRKMAGGGSQTPYGDVLYASIPDNTIDEFVSLVSDVTCSYVSGPVQNFIWSEMQPYFEDQKSYEECMKSLTNKLSLYINE